MPQHHPHHPPTTTTMAATPHPSTGTDVLIHEKEKTLDFFSFSPHLEPMHEPYSIITPDPPPLFSGFYEDLFS